MVLVGHSLGGATVNRVSNAVPEPLHHICYLPAFCPSPALPTPDARTAARTAAPQNENALIPLAQITGNPEQLGAMRVNPRTGDAGTSRRSRAG